MSTKTMSHFARLANVANALKSTGPRSPEGKNASRMNATKHGFRSTNVFDDEDPDEVDASRDRWVACLDPKGEVAASLADLSFRQRRQLDRVLAAEDAALGVRVARARDEVRADHVRFVEESRRAWETDPVDGVARLRVTAEGVGFLLARLDAFDVDLNVLNWCADRSARLTAMEGAAAGADPDPVLAHAVRLFDEALRAGRTVADARGLDDPAARADRLAASARLDEIGPEVDQFKEIVRRRVSRVREILQSEYMIALTEEARLARAAVDLAKFDDSDEGRLRRRYISDAQRDLLRSLREFREHARAAGPKPKPADAPEPEPDAVPEPEPDAADPAPNEPKSGRDDPAGHARRPAPPTKVRRRPRR